MLSLAPLYYTLVLGEEGSYGYPCEPGSSFHASAHVDTCFNGKCAHPNIDSGRWLSPMGGRHLYIYGRWSSMQLRTTIQTL